MGREEHRGTRKDSYKKETEVRYLFDYWASISRQIKSAKHIFLLTDFDGTLTRISASPDLVYLDDEMRKTLRFISKKPHTTIGIISGRSLSDLKSLVKVEGIVYSGNHGFEVKVPNRRKFVHPKALTTKPIIERISKSLVKRLKGIEGVIIENKGLCLSLHYRLVKDSLVSKMRKIFAEEVSPYIRLGKIKVTYGKKILEVRPQVNWDKGKVIAQIIRDASPARFSKDKEVLPIYLGDDRTDEDGFLALKDKGISVFVGRKKRSHANYFLKDVDDVKEFLGRVNSL